jgi:hypothetical protein
MFKAPEYVIKHLPTKHRELMADVLEQVSGSLKVAGTADDV